MPRFRDLMWMHAGAVYVSIWRHTGIPTRGWRSASKASRPLKARQKQRLRHSSPLVMSALRYALAFVSLAPLIYLLLIAHPTEAQTRGRDAILADQVTGVLLRKVRCATLTNADSARACTRTADAQDECLSCNASVAAPPANGNQMKSHARKHSPMAETYTGSAKPKCQTSISTPADLRDFN